MSDLPSTELEELLELCRKGMRVCPQPKKWQELYALLPNTRRTGVGWEPSLPLILGAWWNSTDEQKRERLELHLHWAADHGVLEKVSKLLHSLRDEDWHHQGQ